MLTIKFEVDVNDGVIEIPEKYKEKLTRHIKVIALVDEAPTQEAVVQYSDEYIEKNWREFIVTSLMSGNFEKSDMVQEERAAFLTEKYQ